MASCQIQSKTHTTNPRTHLDEKCHILPYEKPSKGNITKNKKFTH